VSERWPYVFVIDASITLTLVFEDEATAATDELLDHIAFGDAYAPNLWRHECASAMEKAVRRGRIEQVAALSQFNRLMMLPVIVEPGPNWSDALHILGYALAYGLTVYDATYLHLAIRRRVPLATLDRKLAAAARDAGVVVLPDPAA
jgi:predicted nucleic acid-binding protein